MIKYNPRRAALYPSNPRKDNTFYSQITVTEGNKIIKSELNI